MALAMQLTTPGEVLGSTQTRLVDLVDGLLRHGVVLRGEVWLTVADVDQVSIGVDLVLAAPHKSEDRPCH
jgi:hypothetical protein